MRRPKAISRSTMSRASPARSAASRRCWRIAFRPRSSRSIPTAARPCATMMAFASPARAARPAKPSAASAPRMRAAAASRAIPTRRETEKKILRDVLAKGDAWFRTGDLMRLDDAGLLPFRRPDRRHLPLEGRECRDLGSQRRRRAIATGVTRGHHLWRRNPRRRWPRRHGGDRDRRRFRHRRICRASAQRLPAYARPVFIRICATLDATETFKQKKQELAREGFDPHRVTDPLLFPRTEVRRLSPARCAMPTRASSMARSGCKQLTKSGDRSGILADCRKRRIYLPTR